MTHLEHTNRNAEKIAAACILSISGGFLDIYTYLFRGGVFANAVTGNMVLFGFNIAHGQWQGCVKYIIAITSYAIGVFAAEFLHQKMSVLRFLFGRSLGQRAKTSTGQGSLPRDRHSLRLLSRARKAAPEQHLLRRRHAKPAHAGGVRGDSRAHRCHV